MIAAVIVLLLLQSHMERAQSLLRDQKVAEARRELDMALVESPDSVPVLLLAGRVAMAENDFDKARVAFARAASLAPASAQAQFLLGFFHYVDNDFAQARVALERARKLTPDDARTALYLAMTHDGLAQPAQAEPLFEEALRLEDKARRPSAETHVAYARMLFTQGRFSDAQIHVSKALALDPASRDGLYEQARLQLERGETRECIANAEKALNSPGDGVAVRSIYFLLSRAYARAGDKDRAAMHRARFEAIPPRLVR